MNKGTFAFIVIFFSIGFLAGLSIRGCNGHGKLIQVKSDTTIKYIARGDTFWHTIQITNNIPYTVWGHDTVLVTHKINDHDTLYSTLYSYHSDTVAYSDTLRQANEFKAELFDTLAGNRIIGRSLRWANLTPIEVKTITNTVMKKPLVKVYAGVNAIGGKTYDLAPAASVVFADRYMIDLGYYVVNREVTAGLKIKISFHR